MAKRSFSFSLIFLVLLASFVVWITAQGRAQSNSVIHVEVSLVQLNVAVTDNKGNYVSGLQPSDFVISEDGIPQQIATFEQGNEGPQKVVSTEKGIGGAAPQSAAQSDNSPQSDSSAITPEGLNSVVNGANVFILFDTSNYMYRGQGFVYAQDAIADFVRSLDSPYRVAFYSYSRDFFRGASLTADRSEVLRGVRTTVNGDDSALYNALLLTLKDAGALSGRKVVVVFSNGPDNASMVAPEDVSELAQSEGIPIYMISTREAKLDPASSAVFGRISANTGGEAYYAKSWREERQAFASIREDLEHLYFLSYYPQSNPNRGWRAITVKLANQKSKGYHIRTRNGYRPIPARITVDAVSGPTQ
jgi:Ca-activated chloride channel family protein